MIRFAPAPLTVPPTHWRDEPPDRPGRWWLLAPGGGISSWYVTEEMLSPGQILSPLSTTSWDGWRFAFDGGRP